MNSKIVNIADRYIAYAFGFIVISVYLTVCAMLMLAEYTALAFFLFALPAVAAVASAAILIIETVRRHKAA